MKTSGIKWMVSLLIGLTMALGVGIAESPRATARITKKVAHTGPKRLLSPGIGPFFSWFAVQKRMQQ